jgi:GxxExxY protein
MDREIAAKIAVSAFYEVYNHLGTGFLEKNYENALVLELKSRGLNVRQQSPVEVFYKGQKIGFYLADIVVEDCLILELKAVEEICLEHEAQLLNYLKATDIDLGLLMNFGPKPKVRRFVYETARNK